jgi:hypothetical protein
MTSEEIKEHALKVIWSCETLDQKHNCERWIQGLERRMTRSDFECINWVIWWRMNPESAEKYLIGWSSAAY